MDLGAWALARFRAPWARDAGEKEKHALSTGRKAFGIRSFATARSESEYLQCCGRVSPQRHRGHRAGAESYQPQRRGERRGEIGPVAAMRPRVSDSRPFGLGVVYPCSSVSISGYSWPGLVRRCVHRRLSASIWGFKRHRLESLCHPVGSANLGAGKPVPPICSVVGGASRPASTASHHRDTEDTERRGGLSTAETRRTWRG